MGDWMGKWGQNRLNAVLRLAASCGVLAGLLAAAAGTANAQDEETVIVQGTRIPRALEDTHASVGFLTELTIIEKDIQSIREAFRLFANVIDQDWVDAGFILRGVSSEGLTPVPPVSNGPPR